MEGKVIQGQVYISRDSHNNFQLRIEDNQACIRILEIEMTADQFAMIITAMSTKCDIKVYDLDKVGKIRKLKQIEFPIKLSSMVEEWSGKLRENAAIQGAKKHCPQGWEISGDFKSQNSFFHREYNLWAKCNIVKWVSPGRKLKRRIR